jgi:hypothetical protein
MVQDIAEVQRRIVHLTWCAGGKRAFDCTIWTEINSVHERGGFASESRATNPQEKERITENRERE